MNSDFQSAASEVLGELAGSLGAVDEASVKALIEELTRARKVFVVGVGRVMLMLEAFAKRLNHIGVEAYFVGEINEPAITQADLLIIGSGSGETAIPVAIARVAKKYSPRMVHIGSNMHSTISELCDVRVRIPCRTKLGLEDEISSAQPMSTLFEQSLLLLLDAVCLMMIRGRQIDIARLWERHANLE